MKIILKRIVVASLLILLASLAACSNPYYYGNLPAQPPEPTLIAIRQSDAGPDKTPTPFTPSKKKSSAKKAKSTKAAKPAAGATAPAGQARPPDCPKCPETPAEKTSDKTSPMPNPVLDALAKELSLALDTNKAAEAEPAAKKE